MTELDKYKTIYNNPERYGSYGSTNHGKRAVSIIEKIGAKSVVDIGCGHNQFAESINAIGIHAIGVDFACESADVISKASELPFGDNEFDVLTSFDMLEHLLPEEVHESLVEMARVSKRFCLSICTKKSVITVDGENLHPTVRSTEWWKLELSKAGAVSISKKGNFICGDWAPLLKISRSKSVVVVGNGPSLIGSGLGKIIDGFDEIVRFNNFVTDGYEDDVGSRTTLWSAFAPHVSGTSPCKRRFSIHQNASKIEGVDETFSMQSVFYDNIRSYVKSRSRVLSGFRNDTDHILASSGLLMICYLIDVVGVDKVAVCGFDNFKKENSRLHHYWINRNFGKPKEHDGEIEGAIFADLERAGRIEFLEPEYNLKVETEKIVPDSKNVYSKNDLAKGIADKDIKIILVTGLEKTGTSVIAGICHYSGLYGGKKEMLERPFSHLPKGGFENDDLKVNLFHPHLKKQGWKLPHTAPESMVSVDPDFFDETKHIPIKDLRLFVVKKLLRSGWNGTDPLFIKFPSFIRMPLEISTAFPEAKWILCRSNKADVMLRRAIHGFTKSKINDDASVNSDEVYRLAILAIEQIKENIHNHIEMWPEREVGGEWVALRKIIEDYGGTWDQCRIDDFADTITFNRTMLKARSQVNNSAT